MICKSTCHSAINSRHLSVINECLFSLSLALVVVQHPAFRGNITGGGAGNTLFVSQTLRSNMSDMARQRYHVECLLEEEGVFGTDSRTIYSRTRD